MFSHAMLLAQTDSTQFKFVYLLAVVLVGIALPFVIGNFAAKRLRMPDYGWRIGLIIMTVILAGMVVGRSWDTETGRFRIPLGIDLKGGVILIYEVADLDAVAAPSAADESVDDAVASSDRQQFDMSRLVGALSRRINPSGTKEIVIRPYGERQIEIIIPEVDAREVETIKKGISTAGVLQFRIVANTRDHAEIIASARRMAEDPARRRSPTVRDGEGQQIGFWARVAREDAVGDEDAPFKLSVARDTVRDASTGEILDIPTSVLRSEEREEIAALQQLLDQQGIQEIDVLMAMNDTYDVTGGDLGSVTKGQDDLLNPSINFNLKDSGVDRFANLTRDFSPDGDFNRQLGIMLDNYLLSAPNIQEMIVGRGRITGRFTEEEVEFMVNILSAGSLPVMLNPDPISESIIDPLLGRATIEQGKWAIGISLAMVLVFMLFYYRFAGFVAVFALLANLLFILAVIVLIKAPLTLPGLAGLVLTVGMSVDANVLIFERIREELSRGASLRMAIRNGFARATTTIVDANVTTLITAIALYWFGTDQIRGFAFTLFLGILMSMYTAIFCSRVIFDVAERSRFISQLTMAQILGKTEIDFLGKRWIAGGASIALLVLGIVGLVARGADLFDIDFRGGTSVNFVTKEPMDTQQVRDALRPAFGELGAQFTLAAMNSGGRAMNRDFKVDSSIRDVEQLQQVIQEVFQEADGRSQLATYSLDFGDLREVDLRPTRAANSDGTTKRPAEPASPQEKAGDQEQKKAADATDVDDPTRTGGDADSTSERASTTGAPAGDAGNASARPAPPTDDEKKSDGDSPSADEAPPTADDEDATPADETPVPSDDAAANPATPAPATEANPDSTPAAEDEKPADAPTADAPPADAPANDAPANEESGSSSPSSASSSAADPEAEATDTPSAAESGQRQPAIDRLMARADDVALLLAQVTDSAADVPAADAPAADAPAPDAPAQETPAADAPAPDAPAQDTPASDAPAPDAPAQETPAAETTGEPATATGQVETQLTFLHGINHDTLVDRIETAITDLDMPISYFDVSNPAHMGGNNPFNEWTLRISATKEQTQQVLEYLQQQFADTPVWSASNKIGSQVADRMQNAAIYALVGSLFFIIVYIWIRFQRVTFGLAAVVALVHDVAITLGAIALSYWLAGVFGFLLVEEFKISLPIVAALLTIVGYSLNDTIVVFDRIREVRGKSPDLTAGMINASINQTLSRTLLTSMTTLLVVVVLYAIGGEGIHGFAFALVVGVVVGTYSSIFIASPALLWMTGLSKQLRKSATA